MTEEIKESTANVGSAEGDKPQPSENTQRAAVDLPTEDKPMVIERLRSTQDGGIEFVMSLTKEQTYVLVNFAVMALVGQGLAVFHDEPEEEVATPQPAEAAPETPQEDLTIGKQLH